MRGLRAHAHHAGRPSRTGRALSSARRPGNLLPPRRAHAPLSEMHRVRRTLRTRSRCRPCGTGTLTMPMMPSHRCATCGRLVTGRCPSCARAHQLRRPNANTRGYCSPRWRDLRAQKLHTDPFCSVCGRLANEVDHLERHHGPDDPRFWLWSNLDSKCKVCHARKTVSDGRWNTTSAGIARSR
jgi:5-methylcytosine-specific restriction enzyme A